MGRNNYQVQTVVALSLLSEETGAILTNRCSATDGQGATWYCPSQFPHCLINSNDSTAPSETPGITDEQFQAWILDNRTYTHIHMCAHMCLYTHSKNKELSMKLEMRLKSSFYNSTCCVPMGSFSMIKVGTCWPVYCKGSVKWERDISEPIKQ
jgi:hypothetical protein